MAADDSETTQMMAVNNTNQTMGDRNRNGSTSAATDSAGNTDHVDGANTPQRQATFRSPMRTPLSQRRKTKSLRITAGSVHIPAINADIMQRNTDLGDSGDLDGDGSMNLPANMEDMFDNVAINIDGDANNAASFGSETADIYSALQLLGDALPQRNIWNGPCQ